MEGIGIQAIVRLAIQEYAKRGTGQSEPAHQAELLEERKRP